MDFTLIAWMVSSMMGCVWYLDSGASFHMTSDKNLFSALEEKDLKMCIEMGDHGRYSVSGVGTVAFQREHGAPLTLTDMMYVSGLKKNLVSVVMLENKGYDVVFSKGKAFLRHIAKGYTKRIGIRVKNLYKLEVDDYAALSTKAKLVQSQDIGKLWHKRLGHLHHGALKIMHQISTGLPKGKLEQVDTCKGCTLGKYTKSSFHDRDSRVETILKRVHTDLCGPFSTASIAKQRYYVIFIDDYFCEFKALFEKESWKKIKALRSDNGGEYVFREFKDFCAVEGIKQELTTLHNP